MTAPLRLEQLDLTSPALIAEWERAFYKGFAHVMGNRPIRTLWNWDDAGQRLATRIPYHDQVIYYWRDDRGEMASSIATNIAMTQYQSSAFGFEPDRAAGAPRGCELIVAFSLSDRSLSPPHRRSWSGLARSPVDHPCVPRGGAERPLTD